MSDASSDRKYLVIELLAVTLALFNPVSVIANLAPGETNAGGLLRAISTRSGADGCPIFVMKEPDLILGKMSRE